MSELQSAPDSTSKPQSAPNPAERDTPLKALRRLLTPAHFASLVRRAVRCVRERGAEALWREFDFRVRLLLHGEVWRFRADIPLRRELRAQRRAQFAKMPLVSVAVPLYNTPPRFLRQLLRSLRRQTYANWELVLADASDAGNDVPQRVVRRIHDPRIRYLRLAENGGIARNTNAAFEAAHGEYLALLDHDDVLTPNALHEAVKAINEQHADFVYSDEIVLDASLRRLGEYHFKPDFSPDTLRGCNYITHLAVFSRDLLMRAGGGERPEFDGAQDFDLILRLTEQAETIVHIPKVLYWWRGHSGSTAEDMGAKPYAIAAGAAAVADQLKRLDMPGTAEPVPGCSGAYRVRYEITRPGRVTVMIPNKDHREDLMRCIGSLYQNAGWDDLEVLILENNSAEPETFACYEQLQKQYPCCRVLMYEGGFNFSAINNFGARHAAGAHLLLLNNDIEVETPGFVRELLSYSQRPDVGAVGAKLFYPDDTVQHAGVIIGIGGSAGHSHKCHPRESAGDMYRLATTQNFCAVTGACLMVKKELYERMGGLDAEQFAVAYNDVDFCLRLWQSGCLNVMTPFAAATHHESKSRGDDTGCGGEKQARYERERDNFRARYAGLMQRGDPYYNPHFTLKTENYAYQ
ncbi:MAG: glycosyltransferase family 2 protein [Subdoligranulum sp.]|nr:glycosyltransferase family 2 protein [Subdoligranulum sp.]